MYDREKCVLGNSQWDFSAFPYNKLWMTTKKKNTLNEQKFGNIRVSMIPPSNICHNILAGFAKAVWCVHKAICTDYLFKSTGTILVCSTNKKIFDPCTKADTLSDD